jgi:hypothetical protein
VTSRDNPLHKRWVHSYEEDGDDEMVFRPSNFDLPPARGRRSIELRPDGSYVESSPGPVDVPEEAGGQWSLKGDELDLRPDGRQPEESWRVVVAEEDRLRLRRIERGS